MEQIGEQEEIGNKKGSSEQRMIEDKGESKKENIDSIDQSQSQSQNTNQTNHNDDDVNTNINAQENIKSNAIESTRNQKKVAMNRMRNSIKDTLFKGITKKVNAEQSNKNVLGDSTEQQISPPQQISQQAINQQQLNGNNEYNNQQGINQMQINGQEQFGLMENLIDCVKIEQCPRIEFNFGGNSSNMYHTKDIVLNKILDNRESSPQKDLSIINQTRIFEENYELLDVKLGEGCHGDVRKCLHKKSQKIYAVKMIRNGDTEIILSAITSFRIAKNLNHPSVIKPYELFINRETEKIYYVMEYCKYRSLQDYIENIWSLSPQKKDRLNKTRTSSMEQSDEQSNFLSSNGNLDFQEVQNRAQLKLDRKNRKAQKKESLNNTKQQSKHSTKEDDQFITLEPQSDSIDHLTQQQQQQQPHHDLQESADDNNKNNNNNNNQFDEHNDDNIDQEKGGQERESLGKSERRRVQFQGNCQKIEQDSVKKIIKEILIAVDYLHSEGICHRDLKPDNILVSHDLQRVKIIDFEISKKFKFLRQNRSGVLKICEMWTRTGTQDFMSPEMFESTGYTEAVDIWAIGVITYFMLTGRLPFDQEYISDKIEYIRNAQYNLEYMKDLDEIPKDFIRRMLKKDPNERLTAQEALSHPWFLVSRNMEPRIRSDQGLNKSTVINLFYSPQDSDKTSNSEVSKYKELILLKGNQSTVLVKKDDSEAQGYSHLNTYINNSQRNNNKDNHNLNNNNGNKNNGNNNKQSQYGNVNKEKNNDANQDDISNDTSAINDSNGKIILALDKKRSNRMHATEIIKSPINKNQNSNLRQQNEDYQLLKQSLFFNEKNQQNNIQGQSSCRGLKYPQDKSMGIEASPFREISPLCGGGISNKLEDQDSRCADKIRVEQEEEDENERDDSTLRRKKEFKMKIQQFKEQMSYGMTDRLFIHINQKSFKHPPVSQLRLRLLQEKALQKTNSSDKNSMNQGSATNTSESKNDNSKIQTALLINCNHSNQQINPTIFSNSNNNINNNITSQNSINTSCKNIIQFTFNTQSPQNSGLNNNNSPNLNNFMNINSPNNNNNNNNSNNNFTPTSCGKIIQQHQFPFEAIKLSSTPSQASQIQYYQLQNLKAQHFVDNADIDLQNPRSRSNTNDILEKAENEDQIERRAKRLSEDFTSSCIIQNPSRQYQDIAQQSINFSQKNGVAQNNGKVQKTSHFNSTQQIVQNTTNSNTILPINSTFPLGSQQQISIQQQLQLKPIQFVKEFLLSTGNFQEKQSIEQANKIGNDNPLETSINPCFKKIESDDESVQNDQEEESTFKQEIYSNSSNIGIPQTGDKEPESASDVCSIASQNHINSDLQLQKDQIKIDQQSDIIQSSSDESFQVDDDDEEDNDI